MDNRTCAAPDCTQAPVAKGMCRPHYRRARRASGAEQRRRIPVPCRFCGTTVLRELKTWTVGPVCDAPDCRNAHNREASGRGAAVTAAKYPTSGYKPRPLRTVTCPCGTSFTTKTRKRYCHPTCHPSAYVRQTDTYHCERCTILVHRDPPAGGGKPRYCPECRAAIATARRSARRQARRAALKAGIDPELIDPLTIYARDNYLCGICRLPIDPTLSYPARMSASIDHVIPLARGGTHTPENLQPAHLECNIRKSDHLPLPVRTKG